MPVELNVYDVKTILLKELPPGEVFRRESDGKYFFKTKEKGNDNESGEATFICLELSTGNLHRVRELAMAQPVPRTEINIFWK